MEYNNDAFENIDKSCPVSAELGLGKFLDTAYFEIKNDGQYTGELLADEQILALDKMCSASDITDIAYILNNILKASKEGGTVEELSDAVVEKINNGICSAFQSCALGDKFVEMIEIVNGSAGGDKTGFETFSIEANEGVIDAENATITVTVPYGTTVTDLVASFTLKEETSTVKVGSTAQESGVTANDFTSPVVYTVTSEDETETKNWTVTVIVALNSDAQITAYSLASVDGVIDAENYTISVEVPNGTDVTALAATFTLSAQATATVNDVEQTSGTTENDFTNPVSYLVTAENGIETNTYVVTVTVAQ